MEIRIEETGEMKELEIRDDNNIEWTRSLLGNVDALDWVEIGEFGEMIAQLSQGDFDWWEKYISDTYETEEEAEALARELDIPLSEVLQAIAYAAAGDYSDHRSQAIDAMEDLRNL